MSICGFVPLCSNEEAGFGVDMQPETESLLVEETDLRRLPNAHFHDTVPRLDPMFDY